MMDTQEIANYRLINQQIAKTSSKTSTDVVSSLCAVQAQDYNGSLWAIGLRMKNATLADVQEAISEGTIVRTWPMRGTLHLVSNKDVRWILSLYKPQKIMGYHRRVGINETVLEQGKKALVKAFGSKKLIERRELHQALKRSGIPALRNNMARSHIIRRSAREGLICFGPHAGKQATFVLLDNWVGGDEPPKREDAIAKLASRYFTGHGPATVKDFAWWSGLNISEARSGAATAAKQLRKEVFGGETYFMPRKISRQQTNLHTAHLLPSFDEYMIAYKDRGAIIEPKYASAVIAGSTFFFLPTVIFDGRVIGTWRRTTKDKTIEIATKPFAKLDGAQKEAIGEAAERYGVFVESHVVLKYS